MAFCPDCGTENADDARFCQSCGRPMADVAAARAVMEPPATGARTDPQGRMMADDGLPVGQDLDGEPGGERLLWEGRPNRLVSPRMGLTNRYKLTNERLVIEQGFIGRRTEEIDLYRVNDVAVKQNPAERIVGLGDVRIVTTDATSPERRLHNLRDPDRVKDLIREAARAERQRRRVLLRDEV